jgi:alkylation response protein AidB-like acyl-CoA dehydrogenase
VSRISSDLKTRQRRRRSNTRSALLKEDPVDTTVMWKSVLELLPSIRARRQDIERARRLPRDLVDALRSTGGLALSVPRAVGGYEASPTEIMRAIETVATADGSTGCVMIAGSANIAAAKARPVRGKCSWIRRLLRPGSQRPPAGATSA